jgi:hypothetical protein
MVGALMVKGMRRKNKIQLKRSKVGFPEKGKY